MKELFQFPSNGKVDSNTKRPVRLTITGSESFNSLQTGKWIQTQGNIGNAETTRKRFNSLQTGKWIQTSHPGTNEVEFRIMFQFPSNGKVDSNRVAKLNVYSLDRTCFNSLQTGKWIQTRILLQLPSFLAFEFQFPSNGKVDSNKYHGVKIQKRGASFQFPSNGKVDSNVTVQIEEPLEAEFQFPSNGKVDSNVLLIKIWGFCPVVVSIPFKRESGFKRFLLGIGKFFQEEMFQFPSNGKVDSNRPYFKPSGAVAPYVQNQTRTARGIFLSKFNAKIA